MSYRLLLSFGFLAFLVACNSNTAKEPATEQEIHNESAKQESPTAEEEVIGVPKLNNGSRWQANAETSQGIANMKKLVKEFSEQPTEKDYMALQEKLVTELNMIFEKCTMTGEAHEQLHQYLLPLKDLIGQLKNGPVEDSRKVVIQIRQKLEEYSQYFQ